MQIERKEKEEKERLINQNNEYYQKQLTQIYNKHIDKSKESEMKTISALYDAQEYEIEAIRELQNH
jgi:hypothetical protein